MPVKFKSEITIIISENEEVGLSSLGGLGSALNAFGGSELTNLAIGSSNVAASAMLKSRSLKIDFLNDLDLLADFYAYKSYDNINNEIVYDSYKYDVENKKWLKPTLFSAIRSPTQEEILKEYDRNFVIKENKSNGTITITFEHVSPIFAQRFLHNYVKYLNDRVRKKDMMESRRSLDYLNDRASQENNSLVLNSISTVMEKNLQELVFAQAKEDYVYEILDRAFIPSKKSSPQRTLFAVFGSIIGFFISLAYFFIRQKSNKN